MLRRHSQGCLARMVRNGSRGDESCEGGAELADRCVDMGAYGMAGQPSAADLQGCKCFVLLGEEKLNGRRLCLSRFFV